MHRTRLQHQIRRLRVALDAKDKAAAQAILAPTLSLIDHSIRKGILHPNTAPRYQGVVPEGETRLVTRRGVGMNNALADRMVDQGKREVEDRLGGIFIL